MATTNYEVLLRYNQMDKRLNKLFLDPQYDASDNRRHVFGVLRSHVMWSESMLGIMEGLSTGIISNEVAELVFGFHPTKHKSSYVEFFNLSRMSFIANFNFQIENFFKTLLVELGIQDIPKGFYNIVKQILAKAKIPNADKKLDVLYTLARIRNAFHSNGIHTEPTKSITVNGQVFHFIKGRTVFVT